MRKAIILSAGGTGGHMFPAAALAAELTRRGWPVVVASDRRGLRYRQAFQSVTVRQFTVCEPPKTRLGKSQCILLTALGVMQAFFFLLRSRPAVVVGFGGNPSAPAILAAVMLNIPIVLHEQNAVLGRANRAFGPFARTIALSHGDTRNLPDRLKSKTIITGPLVRADIAALHDMPYTPPEAGGPIAILMMGGSQGARVLSTIVPAALAALSPEIRARLRIVQQSRPEDLSAARATYDAAGIAARLEPFITDVPAQLAQAHLFIGRAGGTVAEMTAAGRPAIFIPYPHHADQQQKINAEAVAARGGAWVVDESTLTAESLATLLREIFAQPDTLAVAATAARACGQANAAAALSEIVLKYAGKEPR